MKYFIDFEATQFTNEIIEVGCIKENGETFKSYVKAEKKLTPFIINLTGITQDMVDSAPSSDEVFSAFYQWIKGDTEIEFYCYGNSDIDFVRKNLSKSTNFEAQAALSMIGMALNDYADSVKKHFGLIKPIALVKVLAHYRGVESIEQGHDALEDAEFLKEVFEYVNEEGEITECPFPDYQKPKKIIKPVQPKVAAPVTAHIERIRKNNIVEVYSSMDEAVNWVISQAQPDKRAEIKPENIAKKIRKASSQKQTYIQWKWKIHGGEKSVTNISNNYTYTEPVIMEGDGK